MHVSYCVHLAAKSSCSVLVIKMEDVTVWPISAVTVKRRIVRGMHLSDLISKMQPAMLFINDLVQNWKHNALLLKKELHSPIEWHYVSDHGVNFFLLD
jgi:hypothetical protein